MALTLATASGEVHGLINSFPNQVKDTGFEEYESKHKEELKKKKIHDSKIVKAEYVNAKGGHERLEMHYCKYPGDSIQTWKFIPGFIYEIPLGLVEEVNGSHKRLKKRAGLLSVDGKSVSRNDAPLEKDEEGDWLHKFVPISW